MEKYTLTEEHREQLKPWAEKWIANAMSTKAMDDDEKQKVRVAVRGLYEAANLTPPPDSRIVFVPSPFVMRFATGFSAAIWYKRRNAATYDATSESTYDATKEATKDATNAATYDATSEATWDAIRDATSAATYAATMDAISTATYAATRAATYAATSEATWDATNAATRDTTWNATSAATRDATLDATSASISEATWQATKDATDAATNAATETATKDATRAATRDTTKKKKKWYNLDINIMIDLSIKLDIGMFGLQCATSAYRTYQGGNQWSAFDSFLSFFKDVVKLPLDYSKYQHWQDLSEHSSARTMHADFCIISDRPEILKVDEQNRPHCEDGPFCQWRDGTALFSWHGIRVPEFIITNPETITVDMIESERNQEIKHVMIKRYGMGKYMEDSGCEEIHRDEFGILLNKKRDNMPDMRMVKVINGSYEGLWRRRQDGTMEFTADLNNGELYRKEYFLHVEPTTKTALDGVAATYGMTGEDYKQLTIRT